MFGLYLKKKQFNGSESAWNANCILGGYTVEEVESNELQLDLEWIQLIKEAKNLGIEKEEIREFLSSHREN